MNEAVSQPFRHIQSVKSTNKAMPSSVIARVIAYAEWTHKHTALSEVHRSVVGAEVCIWLGPSHRQAKHNEKNSGVDGSLTYCGDAQKESENKAFIPVFDPIQSVQATNTVMLRYTRVSQKSGKSTLA